MSNESFRPVGNSVLVAVSSSTGQAATQPSSAGGSVALYVSNPSTSSVFLAFGTSAIAAGVPTTSTPCPGLCLPSAQAQVFDYGPNANWISAVTSAGSASIFVTPGVGQ